MKWNDCMDCCFDSALMYEIHVLPPVTIQEKNVFPSVFESGPKNMCRCQSLIFVSTFSASIMHTVYNSFECQLTILNNITVFETSGKSMERSLIIQRQFSLMHSHTKQNCQSGRQVPLLTAVDPYISHKMCIRDRCTPAEYVV